MTAPNDLHALSLTWPLDANSTVWVVGAYAGQTVRMLHERYAPKIHAFEPQVPMLNQLDALALPGVATYPFGLGDRDGIFPMGEVGNDAASFVADMGIARTHGVGRMADVRGFIEEHPEPVDLAVINIEGYEFVLLPYLIDANLLGHFEHLMVQFHVNFPLASGYGALRERIGETHDLLWDYGPAWVAWRRKA